MTEDQIKHMVSRFLGWKLPATFAPDGGISFEPEFNKEWNAKQGKPPQRHEPVGTNVFSAVEAEAMIRHMLEGLPGATAAENVDIDVGCVEDGRSAFLIPHGALGEEARKTLALFSSAVPALIECGLTLDVSYNVGTDTVEVNAKL
jgi:hypothetical protein